MTEQILDVDILIVGQGMAGATLSLALAGSDYKIATIEAFPVNSKKQPSFDERSVALSYGSRLLLEELGVWQQLSAHISPIKEIRVSQYKHWGITRILAREEGLSALGYVVENRDYGRVIHNCLEHALGLKQQQFKQNFTFFAPAKINSIQQKPQHLEVHFTHEDKPRQLRCKLIVGADGIHSPTRQLLGVEHSLTDYGLSCVICNVETQLEHNNCAFERFMPHGPLAFLPLLNYGSKSRSSVVITLKHHAVNDWLNASDGEFLSQLQQLFGYRLGKLLSVGKRASYPVPLLRAQQFVAKRAAIVGNAAQSINPVAGQGFNLALRDVVALAELLKASDEDVGSFELLQQYTQQRQGDKNQTVRFTDTLVKLFANNIAPLAQARSVGLLFADVVAPVRQQVVTEGLGLNKAMSIYS